jgi:succinyl-CoA synthetase beta subunit
MDQMYSQIDLVARKMIGHRLVTKQTSTEGVFCAKVMVVEYVEHKQEFYLSLALNVQHHFPLLIFSKEGGTNIEEQPKESIVVLPIQGKQSLMEAAQKVAMMTEDPNGGEHVYNFIKSIYDLFVGKDCTLLEINPGTIMNGQITCLDAKISTDDNAVFRHSDFVRLEESRGKASRGLESLGMNYIKLDGNIACLVNGAGLSMATMDLITNLGGRPANFLDIGGAASKSQITEALDLINKDASIKAIFVNIFGGIIKCDVIAEAMVKTVFTKPVMLRLRGIGAIT